MCSLIFTITPTKILLFSFEDGEQVREELNDLSKITELVNAEPGLTQADMFHSLCP